MRPFYAPPEPAVGSRVAVAGSLRGTLERRHADADAVRASEPPGLADQLKHWVCYPSFRDGPFAVVLDDHGVRHLRPSDVVKAEQPP